jgi:hypothetical protein
LREFLSYRLEMNPSGDDKRGTVLLFVSKIRSSEVARQSAVGSIPLLPSNSSETRRQVPQRHVDLASDLRCNRPALFFPSHDCSVFESNLNSGMRPRTVGRPTSSYRPLMVRELVRRRKTKRCLVQERT